MEQFMLGFRSEFEFSQQVNFPNMFNDAYLKIYLLYIF